jgi:hypothetical protein
MEIKMATIKKKKDSSGTGKCGSGSSGIASKLQDQMIESSLSKIKYKLIVMSGKGVWEKAVLPQTSRWDFLKRVIKPV